MKKIISIILTMSILLISASIYAFADNVILTTAEKSAAALSSLNLFKGTDKGFELDRAPGRMECVVTIIRLLGEESKALECTDENPFTDVPAWADRYAAYAFKNDITKGISETEFGYDVPSTKQQFAALLLRALAYTEESGDFSYETAETDGIAYGIIDSRVNSDKFFRGDMVIMSYLALSVSVKGTDKILSDILIDEGVFTKEALESVKLITGGEASVPPADNNDRPSSGSSGNSGNSGSTSVTQDELTELLETMKDYYSELSKVIVLVDSEELHAKFDEITELVKEYENINPAQLSPLEISSFYNYFTVLLDDMEMLAIQVAIER